MEREDKRGVFFGVIGVLTLIVAIIGASFAYFSINASSKQDAVNVSAASVKIVYTEGDQIAIENLIPSTREIAMKTLTRGLAGTTHEVEGAQVPYNAEAGTYDVSGFSLLGSDINTTADLAGKGASKNYRLFVWLNEAGEDNNAEQGAIFKGTIHVDLPGANGDITGVAAGE